MSNEIKRMKYFNGLLLKADDLELDQDYHKNLHRMHNRFFHNWGIVDGLKVEAVGNYPQVKVSKGFALNSTLDEKTNEKISQEIWISDNHPDNPLNLSEYDVNEDIYITVSYSEIPSDVDIKKGGDKNIHVWERSKIKHSRIKPDPKTKDEITDIIVARVRLKDAGSGQKSVEGIYDTAEDGVVYAVTQGTAQEFEKISIGAEKKTNLPYINGLSDQTLGQSDGLEVHSPYTKFSGSVIAGDFKTNGNTDLNGTLSVNINNTPVLKVDSKGSVAISKTAAVTGVLSAAGGLNVSGDNTTLDTTHVVMTGNMLTVNKYTPKENETEPRKQSSGVEVYRSGYLPYAKLIWDENEKVWKAGTDKKDDIPGSGIYQLAYGADWDAMHNGSNVDTLHKHSHINDANGNISLAADEDGNVNITNDIIVAGTIVTQNGIEVPGKDLNAKLVWNKNDRRWQIGVENDMYNIPYGRAWEDLTTGTNADLLHTHSEIYNSDGQLAMNVGPTGDVKINSNLTVGENLTVQGTLTVLNPATEYKQINQVITESTVIVNKPDNGQAPVKEGGLEVYRGDGYENARVIWDEGSCTWKMGTGSNLSEIPSGIEWEYLTHGQVVDNMHSHRNLSMEDGTAVVSIDKNGNLDVEKNINVSGNLIVDKDEYIQGDVDIRGSVTIEGDLTVTGTPTIIKQNILEIDNNTIVANKYTGTAQPINNEGGLEVYRGSYAKKARLVWNEKEGKWKVGTENSMKDLAYGDDWETLTKKKTADELHSHLSIRDTKGNVAISAESDNRIMINRATKVEGALEVAGGVSVLGNLDVAGTLTSVNKVDLKVEDNVILLNNFEGNEPPLNESGMEIFRGKSQQNARLIWDEKETIWKIGVGNNLSEIAYGPSWQKLSKKGNADALHNHGQLYNIKGNILSLSTTAAGNIDIKHDLTVSQDLTVSGNLNVKGDVTTIRSANIELEGNKLTMNKGESGEIKKGTSTLSVYRGIDEKSAILRWDEQAGVWKIGMSDWTWAQENSNYKMVPSENSTCLVINNDGSIQTPIAKIEKEVSAGSALIGDILSLQKDGIQINRLNETAAYLKFDSNLWKLGFGDVNCISATSSGKVGIGKLNPAEMLDVMGNAIINGSMDIMGNSEVKGYLTAGSTDIKGRLKVDGSIIMNGGIEVERQVASDGTPQPNAKIVWNEQKCAWTFGFGDKLFELNLNNTFLPSKLYTSNGGAVALVTDNDSNVGIGVKIPRAKLEVNGDTLISGKITLTNSLGTTLKIAADGSLELSRNAEKPAKLYWNEKNKIWQAGIDGSMQDICVGNHTHNNVCTSTGTEVVYVDNSGNVGIGKSIPEAKLDVVGNLRVTAIDISGSLTAVGNVKCDNADITRTIKAGSASITNDLTVGGNLVVNGDTVTINTRTLEVEDNIITLNKYTPQNQPVATKAGIEVFRGGTANSAQVIWDELGGVWQAGTTDKMKTICFTDHTHPEYNNGSISDLTAALKVSNGNIGIGTTTPTDKLSVSGNVGVTGTMTAANVVVNTKLTTPALDVNGTVTSTNQTIKMRLTTTYADVSTKLTSKDAEFTGALTVGTLTAGDTTINGTVTSTNQTIKMRLTTTYADVSTKLTSKDAEFTGALTVGTLTAGDTTINGTVTSTNETVKMRLTTTYADVSTKLTSKDAEVTGALTAATLTAGNTIVNGTMTTDYANVKTKLTSNDTEITGNLTSNNVKVNGALNVSKGIETTRTDSTKACIVWNETASAWEAGIGTNTKKISLGDHTHNTLYAKTNPIVNVSDDGYVGIGKTSETGIRLSVDGDIKAKTITGDIVATTLTQTSSREFKENISALPLKTALDLLKKLNPVTFDYKNDSLKKHNIGFIAEEVPEIFTSEDCKSIAVMDIVAVLTSVVKKQQTETKAIKKQLAALQKQVAQLLGA
ncbi:tail fiber domain-containing protein [Ruminiclostridium cellulolyticum]|uniref:Peptidase S74 domain-containing protein n=1 Tax=Ruminiclostridium cellulolyticum (strain ATCC 35319 / DSM 5812 / JCM 6584 / H10) TaxID=394503 RepID=B8I245_RUMCH|nr:tail fiber domain-containing protein [Ruminiclostridium cellulolyticum]ACL75871.1 hypothetical protein Ccel_1519 [Ruminiclostridium cellulolyticum H10]